MKTQKRPVYQIIEEQVHKWNSRQRAAAADSKIELTVVTLSREPGSGGCQLARELALKLGFDLFQQEILNAMAESARVNPQFLAPCDEKGLSVIEDCINAVVRERHFWQDEYSKHLVKVVGTIAKHGRAVIVGRGANFLLASAKDRLRVRVVAPLEWRVARVAREFGVSPAVARSRIERREADRRAYVRKYFNADITEPQHYDLVLNTENLRPAAAAGAVASIVLSTAS